MGRSQDAVRLLRNGVPGRNGIALGELKEGQLWITVLVVLSSLKDFHVEGGLVFTRKVPRRLELGLHGYIGQLPGIDCHGKAMSSLLAGMCWGTTCCHVVRRCWVRAISYTWVTS